MAKLYRFILWSLIVLNALDALATVYCVGQGWAYEVNPLMRAALAISPWFFLFIKLILIPIILWPMRNRYSLMGVIGLGIVTVMYLLIDLNHIVNLFLFKLVYRL